MSKKLAIKGHLTRGKEVIELLEMMGGKNIRKYDGTANMYSYYLIDNLISSVRLSIAEDDDFEIFTLEEFLEKYPYKVGDKVIDVADGCPGVISEMRWDEDVSDMKYCVVFENGIEFVDFGWFTNDSIEFCKEDKNLDETKVESTGFMQLGKTFAVIFNDANYEDEVELQLGDYEIEVRDGKTYAVKKKYVYPKTIEECIKLLRVDFKLDMNSYKRKLMANFYRLIICRDAYWKIAGEEMGLDKPWEPDWKNRKQKKYCIYYDIDDIQRGSWYYHNSILVFPTKEMRDVFYENFKDLIEQCKELL